MTRTTGQIILYQTDDGTTKIELKAHYGTVWLTQGEISELFQNTKQNISLHIQNILADGELYENSMVKEYLTTASDGKNYLKAEETTKFFKIVQNKLHFSVSGKTAAEIIYGTY